MNERRRGQGRGVEREAETARGRQRATERQRQGDRDWQRETEANLSRSLKKSGLEASLWWRISLNWDSKNKSPVRGIEGWFSSSKSNSVKKGEWATEETIREVSVSTVFFT
jgi:hypothetical protein